MRDHSYFANLTCEIADPLRGTCRSPQYERVIVPKIVLAFIPNTQPKEWPEHRDLRVGTLMSIIRQSGLSRSEFE